MTSSRLLTRPLRAALAVAAALVLPGVSPAHAAESPMPTAQAVAYGMDWIPYIDPADLPPVAQRKVVCLVDSGVDITPDLPPDRPEGPIIERVSIDGGSGLGGPAWENQHGTRMALLAGAVPGNDYGTVGAWPAVRILSVRAMPYGERTFPGAHYDAGVRACNHASLAHPVAVVNLSIECRCVLDADERARLVDAIDRVRRPTKQLSVVAAAGNAGGVLTTPADTTGVIPVAAGDATGGLCHYASFEPRAIVGPGCASDTAEGPAPPVQSSSGGSSSAAAHAAVLLAVLRTLRLDATHDQAEAWLWAGARDAAGRRVLDGAGAAMAAELAPVVARARARMPAPTPLAPTSTAPTDRRTTGSSLATPRSPIATVRWRSRRLELRVADVPATAQALLVRAEYRSRGRTRRVARTLELGRVERLSVRLSTPPTRVLLRYRGDAGHDWRTRVYKRRPSGAYR